jgi:tetratricopeptide (TPR) repeat protein
MVDETKSAAYPTMPVEFNLSNNVDRRLGRIFQQQNRPDLAIEAYQRAIAKPEQPAWVYQSLGRLYQDRGETELAIEAYQRAIELEPNQPVWLYQSLGRLCYEQEKTELAIKAYQSAIELEPNQPAWVYHSLGRLWYDREQTEWAFQAYQKAIALDAKQPGWVYEHLGAIFSQKNRFNEALAAYQQAIEFTPALAAIIYFKIADILNRQGRSIEAQNAYRQANLERSKHNIDRVIEFLRQYFPTNNDLLNIDILDNGCEPTGMQLSLLAEHTQGKVVGTNIHQGFPEATVTHCRDNNEFYWMDGQKLDFEDNCFDAVISLNVLEHVPNPQKYLQECYRVMRSQGFGYFSWYPIWSGATGHHLHPDMLDKAAQRLGVQSPSNYNLNGKVIPFWGHLWLSATEMFDLLTKKHQYHPRLAQWIVEYIYQSTDLNRWFWHDILTAFQSLPWSSIDLNPTQKNIPPNILSQLQLKYSSVEDLKVCGATIIVKKDRSTFS